MGDKWSISKQEYERVPYFTVRWSPWGLMDVWTITRRVPADAGLFQLWVKGSRGWELLTTEMAYYGGLRAILREVVDDMAPPGARLRKVINGRECWFRYTLASSKTVLMDVLWWMKGGTGDYEPQSRNMCVEESETLMRFRKPPNDVVETEKRRMEEAGFGPVLPHV